MLKAWSSGLAEDMAVHGALNLGNRLNRLLRPNGRHAPFHSRSDGVRQAHRTDMEEGERGQPDRRAAAPGIGAAAVGRELSESLVRPAEASLFRYPGGVNARARVRRCR